jgi:hypothetical protein
MRHIGLKTRMAVVGVFEVEPPTSRNERSE